MFNPSRLRFARQRRGLTITGLASMVDVVPRSISGFENNEFTPAEDTVAKLAQNLEFPVEFFYGDDIEVPSLENISFRALSKMSASKRDAACSASVIGFMLSDWVQQRFVTPALNLPDLRDETPEAAAESLRHYWGLGQQPVRNMVRLLEANGIKVFSLAEDTTDVDAYSLWRDNAPYVFLNTVKSAEHSRFDAAHELGHLILHRHGSPGGQQAEREANMFASAFLMPRDSIVATAPKFATIPTLIEYKKRWIVSLSALVYRLNEIKMISEWHNRMLCIEISKNGYRKSEPDGVQRETSVLWNKVFSELKNENISKGHIAKDLCVNTHEIKKLVYGLVMVDVSGAKNLSNNNISCEHEKFSRKSNAQVKLSLVGK